MASYHGGAVENGHILCRYEKLENYPLVFVGGGRYNRATGPLWRLVWASYPVCFGRLVGYGALFYATQKMRVVEDRVKAAAIAGIAFFKAPMSMRVLATSR